MIRPPIKYYGSKGGFYNQIIKHFPNYDSYSTFIEPFGGSGVILLSQPLGKIEIYNDLYNNVYSLYKVISDKNLFDEFKSKCDLAIYSEKLRKEYKEILKEEKLSLVDRAFSYWYVNRTSHNGIGGMSINRCIRRNMSKSTSDFLSCIDRLKELHDRLSSVIILNRDAIEVIKENDHSNVFIYCDAPYCQTTRGTARYSVDMDAEQQKEYIDTLLNIKNAKILVSGYDCPDYDKLTQGGWKKIDFQVNTINTKFEPKQKTEWLYRNYV